jgi:1,4-alpha-glucan branching enzyme
MTAAAREHKDTRSAFVRRLLQQLARELLLAQSSDWAFLMKTGTAVDYATRRTKDHILRFNKLHEVLEAGERDETLLEACEERDNLFPNLEWKHYL